MNARKAAIGLSLLCALLLSAFAASSAMAIPGTTVHTCTQGGTATEKTDKFEDEHCIKINNVNGKWRHVEIPAGTPTEVTTTSAKTGVETKDPSSAATFEAKAFGATLIFSAKEVHGEGTLTNETYETTRMRAKGSGKTRFTGVKVTSLPKCSVAKEEIVAEANLRSATNATEMWVEAEGKGAEELFTSFELQGAECALKGSTVRVRGIAIGTSNGATIDYKKGEKGNTLRVGAEKAGTANMILITTGRMKDGDPLAATTTTE